MRKMTKGLALILLLTMLLSTVAMAAGSTNSLIISAGEVTAEPGGTVTVPVSVTQNPGIVGVTLQITYNSDVLTLQEENGLVNKNLLSGASFVPNATTPGIVKVMFENGIADNYIDVGTLMELNFNVSDTAEAKDYPIYVSVLEAYEDQVKKVTAVDTDGKVTVQAETPLEARIENLTGTTAAATVTAPASGWSDSANTFTVSNSVACVVLVKDANGTYTRLTATGSGNSYSFTTPADFDLSEDQIVIAVKGDVYGNDGKVNLYDVMVARAASNGASLTSPQIQTGDVYNNDGKINLYDVMMIRAVSNGAALNW